MRTNPQRIKELQQGPQSHGPVVYWMSRDQRIDYNWALIHAQDLALAGNMPLRVVFCVVNGFLDAGPRQYGFMLRGLEKCRDLARSRNIPMDLIQGDPEVTVPEYLREINASTLVMDFDPLKIKKKWRSAVLERISIRAFMVDAHNIIPCWITSDKQEYAARTIRPRIHRKLDEYLEPFPEVKVMDRQAVPDESFSAKQVIKGLGLNSGPAPVDWIFPGPDKALETLDSFVDNRLRGYDQHRNDPNKEALSNLSPYLHFGQICSQTIALRLKKQHDAPLEARDGFLEELIVRKELSDNFCYYNNNYDNFEGLPEWGRKTLNKHLGDKRPYLYSLEEFEQGLTHDPLWNAAQMEMVTAGKMHGYMRMYWAKKILEWTKDPSQAIEWAIYLNDRYELDGRDPSGYTGILWSMGGLHDRPWKEREVFGTVRYMSYNGCKRKFDVQGYINKWTDPGR
jgi:deoxyribodipyrimidine photo-lyase